jgi:hypothetical protein
VYDSVESDGRFVLYQIASQTSNVLWLTTFTKQLVLNSLRKMSDMKALVSVLSATQQLGRAVLERDDEDDAQFDRTSFCKDLYRQVKQWCAEKDASNSTRSWIILDDVSTLQNLLGERNVYAFVLSIHSLARKLSLGFALRVYNDLEQHQSSSNEISNDWIGAGGVNDRSETFVSSPFSELADFIVDVAPLASGYTREAHGRLIFTGRRQSTFNYCLTDNKVLAIRVHQS